MIKAVMQFIQWSYFYSKFYPHMLHCNEMARNNKRSPKLYDNSFILNIHTHTKPSLSGHMEFTSRFSVTRSHSLQYTPGTNTRNEYISPHKNTQTKYLALLLSLKIWSNTKQAICFKNLLEKKGKA